MFGPKMDLSVLSKSQRQQKILARIFVTLAASVLVLSLTVIFVLLVRLFLDGTERLHWDFITSFPSRFPEKAGILSAWVGSFCVVLLCLICSIPLGIACAIYLEEFAKNRFYSPFIEICIGNLAGVPSITYGLLALGLFVYQFGFGSSIMTAGLTLSLLVLPVIIISTRESLRSVPLGIKEAAYGLGATKVQVLRHHLIPYSQSGIFTGVILSLSRAIGETAPLITIGALTFIAFLPEPPVMGSFPFVNFNWVWESFTVLPIQLFNWTSRPQAEFHKNAAAASFILVCLSLLLNSVAIFMRQRHNRKKYD